MLFTINQTKLRSRRQFFFSYYSKKEKKKKKKGCERKGISQLPDEAKRCKSTWNKRWENGCLNTKTRRDTGDTRTAARRAGQESRPDPEIPLSLPLWPLRVPGKFRSRLRLPTTRRPIRPLLITCKTVIGPLKAWVNVSTYRNEDRLKIFRNVRPTDDAFEETQTDRFNLLATIRDFDVFGSFERVSSSI